MDVCCDAKAQTIASMKVRTELLSPSPVIRTLLITLQKLFVNNWGFLWLEVIEKKSKTFRVLGIDRHGFCFYFCKVKK